MLLTDPAGRFVETQGHWLRKAISVEQLLALLNGIASNNDVVFVEVNRVGNLVLCEGAGGPVVGYIDFASETIE